MPAFYNQLYTRAWWAIYILDRRIAIESGKPCLIQDSNVDTALPINLSDEWMTRFATRKETIPDLKHEVAAEAAKDTLPSPFLYLAAMVRYSRVAGKAWQVLYGIQTSGSSSSAMVEYVDTVLCRLLDTAPRDLKYDPEIPCEVQFSMRPQWLVKQALILFTSCTYLRLLVRRPLLNRSSTLRRVTQEDDLESAIESAGLAAKILNMHQCIKDDVIKYSFALSHYVTSCTIIMVGLLSNEPGSRRRYGALILAAVQSLDGYCRNIWVSGKMMRCVSRLGQLVQQALAMRPHETRDQQSPSSMSLQLTSQADDHGRRPSHARSEPSVIFPNGLTELSTNRLRGSQVEQGSDDYPFSGETIHERQAATSWMSEPTSDRQHSWLTSNFTFESFGERVGLNGAEFSTALEHEYASTLDAGEEYLGVLGMTAAFDIDSMSLDPALMNLYDASSIDMSMGGG
ncbi:hypothetical protein NX059_011883 [Plenodomus lindquistii]|nr:hypothetical protein NX059_011883 [Plenodomus lindquistii]